MIISSHPSEQLSAEVLAVLRGHALAAEQNRSLTREQIDTILENKWFNMFVPDAKGGLALTLPQAIQLEEALAWADGSVGWVVTLCAGAGWFYGFVDPELHDEFFNGPQVCLAGSGAATGTAERSANGYRITGTWKYASGALHATAFTMNCTLTKDGAPLQNNDGSPKSMAFILKRNEVTVKNTWNMMGMRATGSHSFEARNVLVPFNRAFVIDPSSASSGDPIYHFPFMEFAEVTLSANLSGMALRFIELASEFISKKRNDRASAEWVATTSRELDYRRKKWRSGVHGGWEELSSTGRIADNTLEQISNTSQQLAHLALKSVQDVYPLCGLGAADMNSEINRVWRNLHTASQHAIFKGPASIER